MLEAQSNAPAVLRYLYMEPVSCCAQYTVWLENRTAIGPGPGKCGTSILCALLTRFLTWIPLEELKTN